jgi:ABC-type sugar transport system substrate-binding protein
MARGRAKALYDRRRLLVTVIVGLVLLAALGGTTVGAATSPSPPITPTKALCKGKKYKIGYDVFSGTQPFANLVTQGLKEAAKRLGCVTVRTTIDNLNGPVAVGNIKTLLTQKVDGIIDFNVLAPYQRPIAALLKKAGVPGVAIVGAELPGYPSVGADNYGASVLNGRALAAAAKKKYPGEVPYLVVAAEPSAGPIILQRYTGAVAGAKQIYPNLPGDHIIRVDVDGTEADSYNKTLSTLSRIPADGVVLLTGVNDEATHGTYKAAGARGLTKYLVNSFGGDPFGLSQVCADREHYVGALYLLPKVWGSSALAVVLRMINKLPVPKQIGIKGTEVTASNPIAGCK